MDEYGYEEKEEVKCWYDGFTFGTHRDIYNPWSILNYLSKRQFLCAPSWRCSHRFEDGSLSKMQNLRS